MCSCWIDFVLGKDRLMEGCIVKISECCMFVLNLNVCIFLIKLKGVLFFFLFIYLKVSKFFLVIKSLVGNKDCVCFFYCFGVASCGILMMVIRVIDLWIRKGLNVIKFILVLFFGDLNIKKVFGDF